MKKDIIMDFVNDSIEKGIHIVDKEGYTLVYNEAMTALEGLSADEVMDRNLLEVLPSLKGNSTLMRVLETGKPILNKFQTYFNEYGKHISTVNSTWPICKDGQIIGAIEVANDITKIRELAEKVLSLQEELYDKKISSKSRSNTYYFDDIIGESPQIQNTKQFAKMASKTSSNILIVGESGTGKELVAQSIHNASNRRNKPFIAENCAALPETLLESLLFGTSKGSFTGAIDKPGLFEQADSGTLMLDEINSMSLGLQAKLLRVIQEGSFRPIGGNKEIKVDVRIIAVTNDDPMKLMRQGKLREDLFYRLSVVNLFIPPLREREGDIETLTNYFIHKYENYLEKSTGGLDSDVREFFFRYKWPGNVRELEHVIEGSINLANEGDKIKVIHLPYYLQNMMINTPYKHLNNNDTTSIIKNMKEDKITLDGYIKSIELDLIKDVLKFTEGNLTKASKILGITRQGLQYKLSKKR